MEMKTKSQTELLKPRVRSYERSLIREALTRYPTRKATAAALGISLQGMRTKLKRG